MVEGRARSAALNVSADGRYILYLNGKRLGRGPARCHPGWQYLDPYDVAELLVPGRNVLAALVHSYGRDTSWYQLPKGPQAILFGCAGFYLEGAIATAQGIVRVDSDASWKFLVSPAWERDTAFGGTGFIEHFDGTLEPEHWNRTAFDDSLWEKAYVQRVRFPAAGSDIVPFPRLVERDIAFLEETLVEPAGSFSPAGFTESTASTTSADVTSRGDGEPIVFDFGRILLGRICVEVEASAGSELEIECGETLGPDGLVFRPGAIPGISTPLVHKVRFRGGRQSHTLFEAYGFRYVQVRGCGRGDTPKIVSLKAEETKYPAGAAAPLAGTTTAQGAPMAAGAPALGSFSCSDETLTRIWKVGAYTASICRQDGFIDCPSREQRQWTGDANIQSLLNYVTCGDTRLVRKMLLQSAQTQGSDGMIMMASTSDLAAEARTIIPDYCLHWILSIGNYLLYTGDESPLLELFPSVAKAIEWFVPYLDRHGLLADVPGWLFIDWSDKLDRGGEVLALNALFVGALRAAARVADILSAPRYARRWGDLASSVAESAAERLWDSSRGLYADARGEDGLSRVASQQGNAAAIAFGIAPRDRWESMLSAILDPKRLVLTRTWKWDIDRPFDTDTDIVLAQPFFSHYLHAALAAADKKAEMVSNIASRWSSMLEDGGSTFWESWQLTEMTSRCHAFSATPTFDLSTYVLGVKPIADGYSRFRVSPYFVGLDWARGEVPAVAGSISVSWERKLGAIEMDIEAPWALLGVLALEPGCGARTADSRTLLDLEPGSNHINLLSS